MPSTLPFGASDFVGLASVLSATGADGAILMFDVESAGDSCREGFSVGSGVDAMRDANCTDVTPGEYVEPALDTGRTEDDAGLEPGGGGNGAIPTPLRSLAAAAAAADAYFSVSPGNRVGGGAGFIEFGVDADVGTDCRVARTGRGDFICVDGRLPDIESALGFARGSAGSSSGIDCVSCEDTRSLSWPTPNWPSPSPRFKSSYSVSSSPE